MEYTINREQAIKAYGNFMQALGLSLDHEGNHDTPRRVVDHYLEFLNPPEPKFTVFDSEGFDEMIISHKIEFDSLCEHHHLLFSGTGAIAYIPGADSKIVGLSKLARTLEFYSRRFQNQERITQQVGKKLVEILKPAGIAVVLKAEHSCMACRGAKKKGSEMITSYMTGAFKTDLNTRNEFLQFINK
jgi:GTP cyclohydrolase IA